MSLKVISQSPPTKKCVLTLSIAVFGSLEMLKLFLKKKVFSILFK